MKGPVFLCHGRSVEEDAIQQALARFYSAEETRLARRNVFISRALWCTAWALLTGAVVLLVWVVAAFLEAW